MEQKSLGMVWEDFSILLYLFCYILFSLSLSFLSFISSFSLLFFPCLLFFNFLSHYILFFFFHSPFLSFLPFPLFLLHSPHFLLHSLPFLCLLLPFFFPPFPAFASSFSSFSLSFSFFFSFFHLPFFFLSSHPFSLFLFSSFSLLSFRFLSLFVNSLVSKLASSVLILKFGICPFCIYDRFFLFFFFFFWPRSRPLNANVSLHQLFPCSNDHLSVHISPSLPNNQLDKGFHTGQRETIVEDVFVQYLDFLLRFFHLHLWLVYATGILGHLQG